MPLIVKSICLRERHTYNLEQYMRRACGQRQGVLAVGKGGHLGGRDREVVHLKA